MTSSGRTAECRRRTRTPRACEGGEELLLGPGGRRDGPDVPVQHGPVRLAAGPGRLFHLGPGQGLRGGAVRAGQHAQPVGALDVAQRLAEPVVVVLRPGRAAVLPGEGGDDVDVVVAVVHRDPAHALVLAAALGQAQPVHDLGGDRVPRAVAELGVIRGAPDRHVVDELAGDFPGERTGSSSSAVSLLKLRLPSARRGGSRSAGWIHPATRCGLTCWFCLPLPYR